MNWLALWNIGASGTIERGIDMLTALTLLLLAAPAVADTLDAERCYATAENLRLCSVNESAPPPCPEFYTCSRVDTIEPMPEGTKYEVNFVVQKTDAPLLKLNAPAVRGMILHGACDSTDECEDRTDDLCDIAGHGGVRALELGDQRPVLLVDPGMDPDDAPGGLGKVPLLPNYVQEVTDEEVVLRTWEGKLVRYPNRAKRDWEEIPAREQLGRQAQND